MMREVWDDFYLIKRQIDFTQVLRRLKVQDTGQFVVGCIKDQQIWQAAQRGEVWKIEVIKVLIVYVIIT